jgi:hypothetical protein
MARSICRSTVSHGGRSEVSAPANIARCPSSSQAVSHAMKGRGGPLAPYVRSCVQPSPGSLQLPIELSRPLAAFRLYAALAPLFPYSGPERNEPKRTSLNEFLMCAGDSSKRRSNSLDTDFQLSRSIALRFRISLPLTVAYQHYPVVSDTQTVTLARHVGGPHMDHAWQVDPAK